MKRSGEERFQSRRVTILVISEHLRNTVAIEVRYVVRLTQIYRRLVVLTVAWVIAGV